MKNLLISSHSHLPHQQRMKTDRLNSCIKERGFEVEGAMAFAGTTHKCMTSDKTFYPVDKLTAENRVYHKQCFRCHHCKGTLKLGKYNSFEGVHYCRPHFDQLFKRERSFEGTLKIAKPEKPTDSEKSIATKASCMFAGTRDKCFGCKITIYRTDKVTVNGIPYHKSCFKCIHGGAHPATVHMKAVSIANTTATNSLRKRVT